jgi:hypothetical protein
MFVSSKMATFHAKGKVQLIIHVNKFGISHVIENYLCAMLDFHPGTMDVSKDDAYDANNNVITSIYHVSIIGDLSLEWKVNAEKFKIIVENLSKSS